MPWGAGVPGPAPPLLLSEADGRVNPTRAVPSPRGPRSASRWDKPTMGREIIRNWRFTPPPTSGCFSPRAGPSRSGAAAPGAYSPSNKFNADLAFVTFPSPHSTADAEAGVGGGCVAPNGPPLCPHPTMARLMLCHPRRPPRHQGSHMQYLFLSEGSCFNSEKQGPSSEPRSVSTAPNTSFAQAAAAQVITEPRETRPGLCFLHKAADMFPTVIILFLLSF